ncbi:helix-turn-helix domain-containing protein [Streptococcus anginosus]|uniref:helix-turn-helix domain-containing protein n=1 Tax=Streptococcus anginosus TaxID=1328 RepID=UPI00066E32A7|nr:helix-turn-helix transcriptional regulator [Streptococcus anginosus]
MFSLFEKIKELCQQRGISINYLEETLGYSRNTIYSMKSKKPNAERLQEIADYFNVSTDYLLGRTDNPAIARKPQTDIDLDDLDGRIMLFDGKPLTDDDKRAIQGIINGYMSSKE